MRNRRIPHDANKDAFHRVSFYSQKALKVQFLINNSIW